MKIGMSLLVLLLLIGRIASAQANSDSDYQVANFAPEPVRVYESPNLDAKIIEILQQNETIQSDGLIPIGNAVM